MTWLGGLAGALLLAGSVWAQDATTIAEAQDALEAARSTRAVRALAAPDLDAAERALERARAAREAGLARDEVEHLAYLALRRAAIARMRAKERQAARALESLSAAHALITEARALEAAAAERRARALAQRLARFDVRAGHGLLLTPRERWFDTGLTPAPRALRAIAEAARLLGELPERQAVVLGSALHVAPQNAVQGSGAGSAQLPARYRSAGAKAGARAGAHAGAHAGAMSRTAIDNDDVGCARADVVRAFLISHGVDPRRVVADCVAASAPAGPAAGDIAIQILPENGSARTPTIGQAIDPGLAAR